MRQWYRRNWMNTYFRNASKGDPSSIEFMHTEQEEDYEDPPEDFGHGEHLFNKTFISEVILLLMIPIPGYDRYIMLQCQGKETVYLLSEFMLVFMCLRVYFLVRSMLNFTEFMDPYAKKLCKAYGFDNSVLFTIKSSLIISPEATASYIFLVTLILFAYLVRVLEMPRFRLEDDDTFDYYFNSIWFTVVTLTTIGYGDFSPMT